MTGEAAATTLQQDGLAIARDLLARGGNPPIGDALRFSMVEVEARTAVFEGIPGEHAFNPMGFVHGGYAATLLDSACGIATLTRLPAGHRFTTLELKVAYHRQMTEETGTVRAEGSVVSIGSRVAFAEAKITDSEGRLLASATSTLLVIAP